ncbi:MAG: MFS transporter [Methylococcaceae bacterium]|nr:MFS transporter [Methylococcaceae bacterium]
MSQMNRVIASTMVGNGLEWYDYALYGTFTALISKHFFPPGDDAVALIATFGIFAIGFLMRPLGAMFFGAIGDKFGRKNALALSILLMAFPTACIGLLPTYQAIGLWAPILLTVIRLVQGIAVGGEFGGSIVYLVEHSSPHNRNFIGSLSMLSMLIGLLSGAMMATALAEFMPAEAFESYGWRIPFILGFFIGIVGLYIRSKLDESPVFIEAQEAGHISETPIKDTLQHNYKEILLGIGAYLAVTIPFYIQTVFMPSFMVKFLKFSQADALLLFTVSLITMMVVAPLSAILADKKDRETLLKIVLITYGLFAIPYITLLDYKTFSFALGSQIAFSIILGAYIAPIPTLVVELFPTKTRYTGMSLACNLAAAIFGGTAPIVVTKLITLTDSHTPIAFYIIFAAAVSFFCITLIKIRRQRGLMYLV